MLEIPFQFLVESPPSYNFCCSYVRYPFNFLPLKLSPPARANSRIMLCTHKMQNETIIVCNSIRNCYLWTLVMFLIDPESTPQKWRSSKRKRWHWEWLKMTICFIYFSITGIIIDSINVPPRYITFVVNASTTPPNREPIISIWPHYVLYNLISSFWACTWIMRCHTMLVKNL